MNQLDVKNNTSYKSAVHKQHHLYFTTKQLQLADHIAILLDEWFSTSLFIDIIDSELKPFLNPPHYKGLKINEPIDYLKSESSAKLIKIRYLYPTKHFFVYIEPSPIFNKLSPKQRSKALQVNPFPIKSKYEWEQIKEFLIDKYCIRQSHKALNIDVEL